MFSPGTAKLSKAARNSAKSRARFTASMALISSLGECPLQRSAKGAPGMSLKAGTSEMSGPQGVSRTSTSRSNHHRTRIVSRRVVICASLRPEASYSSLEAARMLVPPQAIQGLRPRAKKGRPGGISPTACSDGDLTPASSHRLGR